MRRQRDMSTAVSYDVARHQTPVFKVIYSRRKIHAEANIVARCDSGIWLELIIAGGVYGCGWAFPVEFLFVLSRAE